ncbi:hypothetical protein LMG26857_03526 [Achromobacter anxifer]|uniref:hypothetical protein n=1 Tax=Achromobacter anxifer TaxID=1287737 RepID=UPI00155C1A96|nr:hypothetical protein [Achromobacter anxifer]CAB5514467.1 hypothetical protein LMG26857_03526 [Achromobacter anxifer]
MCQDKCAGGLPTCNPHACTQGAAGDLNKGVVVTIHKSQGAPAYVDLVDLGESSEDHCIVDLSPDAPIRYEVHIMPLQWASDSIKRLVTWNKGIAERCAQRLADSKPTSVVMLEAYKVATDKLLSGVRVSPKGAAAAGTLRELPAVSN